MRDIKFRGYGSEWRYGSYVKDYFKDRDAIIYNEPNGKRTVSFVNRESVGQFTGKKDANGNDVFEGDIIEYTESSKFKDTYIDLKKRTTVEFKNGMFGGKTWSHFRNLNEFHRIEVVGNIFNKQ